MRAVAIALIALAFGLAGLLTIGAAVEIVREPICKELNQDPAAGPGAECFAGSVDRRALVGVLLVGSGGAAFAATMAGFFAAATGRRPGLFAALATVSVLFFVVAYVAVRVG